MTRPTGLRCISVVVAAVALAGCLSETQRAIATHTVAAARERYFGPKARVAIGSFKNESPYMRGIFSDDKDRLGSQARSILKNHLIQSGRFEVLERENLENLAREAKIGGIKEKFLAANLLITGAVTEFGRRETGAHALGGIIGRTRRQTAYAKVSLSVVDIRTSRSLFATQGAGECSLQQSEFLGFGGSAGYDSTLNGKVLNLAITEVVRKLIEDLGPVVWTGPGE